MLRSFFRVSIASCFLVVILVAGCTPNTITGLEVAEEVTLYSIEELKPGQTPKTGETFHGYSVLGKVSITEPEKRREIGEALNKGIADSDGTDADCFWPRHALRVVGKSQTVDYVICFECYQIEVYSGGAKQIKLTTREPQAVLNRHLKEAGIPPASGMVSEDE